jgi:hypothetical protein
VYRHDMRFLMVILSPPRKCKDITTSRPWPLSSGLLPDPFRFIIHPSYHSTPYSLASDNAGRLGTNIRFLLHHFH